MKRPKLVYQDFQPLYIGGKRSNQYVSPSTGEIISRRQFQQGAHGGQTLEKLARQKREQSRQKQPSQPKQIVNPAFLPLYQNGKRDKKHRYVNPDTGQVISSSTYYRKYKPEPLQPASSTTGRESGGSSTDSSPRPSDRSERSRQIDNSKQNILRTYTDKLNRDARENGLPPITEKEAAKQAEFKWIVKALKSKDKSAKGPKAQALVLLGLRDASWTNDVGTSP